jgi:predicted GNAT family acetyltransferase
MDMEDVQLKLNKEGQGAFYIMNGEEQIAEMVIQIRGKVLTVYHTEVLPKEEGKGYSKKLLNEMVDYVRKNGLKVVPLCPFVHLQFRRHPDQYEDIWLKGASDANSR